MKRIYILSIDSLVVKHMPDNYKKYTDSLSGIESKYPLLFLFLAGFAVYSALPILLIFLQSVCNIAVLII